MALVKPLLVVDSDFSESLAAYSATVDRVQKSTEFSTKVQKLSEDLSDEFYTSLVDSALLLKEIPDKDFEPAMNALFYFVAEPVVSSDSAPGTAEAAKFEARLSQLLSHIVALSPTANVNFNDRVSLKFTSVLSVLTIYFNLISQVSALRLQILETILSLYEKLDAQSRLENLELLKPLFSKSKVHKKDYVFERYLVECGAAPASLLKFTLKLTNLISETYTNEALSVLKSVSLKNKAVLDKEWTTNLVVKSLQNPREIDLSYLHNFLSTQLASLDSELLAILNAYTKCDNNLSELSKLAQNKFGIDAKTLVEKKKLFIVANLALSASESYSLENSDNGEEENKNKNQQAAPTLTFKEISDSLHLNDDLTQIESILIKAIRLNILSGKIDQLKQVFTIYKINLIVVLDESHNNQLSNKEWKFLLSSLKSWKKSLNEALSAY